MKYLRTTLVIVSFLFYSIFISGQVRINEVVSSNNSSLIVNGTSPDWIELYNDSSEPIDLTGYYLSDNPEQREKWIFPSTILNPDKYLVILADGADIADSYLHTNFKIDADGETLTITDNNGVLLDEVEVPKLETDVSYGKIDDDWFLLVPTPAAANIFNQAEVLEPPNYNMVTGVYASSQALEITYPDNNVEIEYFINDLANKNQSINAEVNLVIDTTTIICARVVKQGAISSDYLCNTYVIGENHQIPILSVIADDHKLFDPIDGLFELGPDAEAGWPFYGANFWSDRDEEVYFQYFNQGSNPIFKAHADLEMHGGRESRTNPQKTFRLLAKEKYKQPFFEYPFFKIKSDINTYKRIVLRNASGDFNAGHCRDGFLQDYLLANNLDLDGNAYQPVAVYLNGLYYGMMGVREKMDKYYTLSNHGTIDIDLLEEQALLNEGSLEAFDADYEFIRNNDLSDTPLFEQASREFDLTNLTDYFLSQICNNSTAWPQNNIKFWKGKSDDAKWRYLLYDMDISLGRWPWTFAEENSLRSKMTTFQDTNVFINTVKAFLDNDNFKNYFLNRHQDLYNTDFSTDSLLQAFYQFTDTIRPEINRQLERWPTNTMEEWETKEILKITTFIKERPDYSTYYFDDFFDLGGTYNLEVSIDNIENGTIHLNSLKDIKPNFKGDYFKQIPITLTAISKPGKYFRHWEIIKNGVTTYVSFSTLRSQFDTDVKVTAIFKDEVSEEFIESIYFDNSLNTFLIKMNTLSDNALSYQIYDRTGRLVDKGEEVNISVGENYITIPTSLKHNGIYFIHLSQEESFYNHKFFFLY